MRRRDFLKTLSALPALTAVPRLNGVQIRITDIRVLRLKVIKDLGPFVGFMGPWDTSTVRVGGGSALEIHTDQGLVGIGPAVDPVQLPALRSQLLGEDPFNLQILIANLREQTGLGVARRMASRPGAPDAAQVGNQTMNLSAAAGRGGKERAERG
jgi:hypothetical protein